MTLWRTHEVTNAYIIVLFTKSWLETSVCEEPALAALREVSAFHALRFTGGSWLPRNVPCQQMRLKDETKPPCSIDKVENPLRLLDKVLKPHWARMKI